MKIKIERIEVRDGGRTRLEFEPAIGRIVGMTLREGHVIEIRDPGSGEPALFLTEGPTASEAELQITRTAEPEAKKRFAEIERVARQIRNLTEGNGALRMALAADIVALAQGLLTKAPNRTRNNFDQIAGLLEGSRLDETQARHLKRMIDARTDRPGEPLIAAKTGGGSS